MLSSLNHGNREVETSILQQQGKTGRGCLPTALAALPSTEQTAIALTTTEVAKWLVQQLVPEAKIPTLAGKIITFDQTNFTLKTHSPIPSPIYEGELILIGFGNN
jgi:oxazoline/thiazoline synthase